MYGAPYMRHWTNADLMPIVTLRTKLENQEI